MAETDPNSQDHSESESEDSFPPLTEEQSVEAVGTTVGRYKLLSVLGEGGFGMVYLAEQERPLKRRVALKVIKPGMDTKQVIARFEAERQALALLDHPNIAHVFDAGTTDAGRPYFVMELVQGLSIVDYCDRHKLGIKQRLELFIEVCEAVQYAHQKGIIHRDLKPSNILVSVRESKPVPVVIDFGVAKAMSQSLTERTLFTEQGQFIGTPEYISPEQAEMTAEQIDTRSDIYSLGVVLYELLAGTLPFESETLREGGITSIRKIIRHEAPKTPSTRLSGLGDQASRIAECRHTDVRTLSRSLKRELEWIPLKAMRKEPDRRYRTVSDLVDDMHNYLTGSPLEAGPESVTYRIRKFMGKHAVPVATVVGFLLLIVVALAVSIVMYSRAERARIVAEAERIRALDAKKEALEQRVAAENATEEAQENLAAERQVSYFNVINRVQNELKEGNIHLASQLLESCRRELRGWEWHYLWRVVLSFRNVLPIYPELQPWSAISSSGKFIAVRNGRHWEAASSTITVWDTDSGAEIVTLRGHKGTVLGAALDLAGDKLVSCADDKTIKIWDMPTGSCLQSISVPLRVTAAALSPDGARVVSDMNHHGIAVWDVATGDELRVISDTNDMGRALAYNRDGTKILRLGAGGQLHIWNESGEVLFRIADVSKGLHTAVWHPDGEAVAYSDSNSVSIYDVATGAKKREFRTESAVWQAAFSPDGTRLAWGDMGGLVAVTNVESGLSEFIVRGHRSPLISIAFTEDGHHIISASSGEVYRWNIDSPDDPRMQTVDFLSQKEECSLALMPDGQHLVAVMEDRISICDVRSGRSLQTIRANIPDVGDPFTFSRDGRYIAKIDPGDNLWETGLVRAWDLNTGNMVFRQNTADFPNAIALSPDGTRMALLYNGSLGSLAIWDVQANERAQRYGVERFDRLFFELGGQDVAYSPDGDHLAICGQRKIYILDSTTGRIMNTFDIGQITFGVSFSPNGRYVLADYYRGIGLWDIESGRSVFSDRSINPVSWAFSRDCRRILLVRTDRVLELRDIKTGTQAISFDPEANVQDVCFSENGHWIVAVGRGGKILIWDAMIPNTDEEAREWYARGVTHFYRVEYDLAVSALTECLELVPDHRDAYRFRGLAHSARDDYELAISDLQKALDLSSADAWKRDILTALGDVCEKANRLEEANRYYQKSFQLVDKSENHDQSVVDALRNLARISAKQGNYGEAKQFYLRMLKTHVSLERSWLNAVQLQFASELPRVYHSMGLFAYEKEARLMLLKSGIPLDSLWDQMNALAWLCATSPDPGVRDGALAVKYAVEVCELTEWEDASYMDTLAAAYAETGEFAKAIEMQKKVIELLGEEDDGSACKKRLALYEKGQPYREDLPSR